MNRHLLSFAAGILVVSGLTGCVDREAQERAKRTEKVVGDRVVRIRTEPVKTMTLTETLVVTGDVTAGEDTTVGAKTPGRIAAVYVKDGDTVAAGQLLATLDQTQARAQLAQAMAQVSTARAAVSSALAQARQARSSLTQARRNATTRPQQSEAGVRQAQAQLSSARAQLEKARNGARPEERRQAQASLEAARTNLMTQEAEMARIEKLVKEGAVAANRLDQQRAATATARSQFQNATEALNVITNGTRSEDVAVAEAAVRTAEQAVANAKATQELDPLLQDQVAAAQAQVDAVRAQGQSARAQLESAQAQVQIAQQALSDTEIRAPFSGKISGRPEQVGTIAGTQTAIARIVGGQGVYFTGQLPSSDVVRVQPGMTVTVTVASVPNRSFQGTVAAVSPQGSGVARLFDVRIALPSDPAIRPGMFASGEIALRKVEDATVVKEMAVVTEGKDHYVFVAEGDKAKRIKVDLGLIQGDYVQVTPISSTAKVVTEGQTTLTDGAQVTEEAPAATDAEPKGGKA